MKRIDKAIKAYMLSSAVDKEKTADPSAQGVSAGKTRQRSQAAKHAESVRPKQKKHVSARQSTGAKRAAKLLMLLEQDAAGDILKHLTDTEVEKITREIAGVGKVDRAEAHKILDGFRVKKKRVASVTGGTETAKEILINSFGQERGMSIYRRAVPIEIDNPLDFLDDLDFQQILMLLKKESASVISVILPYMAARTASQVLESLPPDQQKNVVKRIAKMEKISPYALMKVAESLREKIRKQGRLVTEEMDGTQVLADILENMSPEAERDILEQLDGHNPEVADHLRDRLFTIDVVFGLADPDLQAVLREFSEEEIAVVVKGKTAEVRERLYEGMSQRRQALVDEEGISLGAMKRRDVDKATREFVGYIRELAEDGKIGFPRRNEGL